MRSMCITTCEELQLHAHKAKMLSYRGLAHLVANSPSKAVSDAEQCLVIANRIGSVEAEPLALAVVAAVHAIRGSRESASEAWNAASSRLTMQMGARMRPILRAISPAIYDSPQSSTRHDHFAEASQSPSAQLRLMRRALSRYSRSGPS